MKQSNNDIAFLKETFRLARKGMNWTFPNPLVGAVIVKNGKIVAKGYHTRYSAHHAEIEAISLAGRDLARLDKATLYVNLEPCTHFGKTPPCVDAIIKSGIKRVVCSTLDPNPVVSGKGIAKLKKAGIEVTTGILEKEARQLNEAFFTFHEKKRPFIALKFAASLDGKIATRTGDSRWITNEKAREFARKLRSQYQAVIIGINTVLVDNPHLGVRQKSKKDPLRIILDSTLKIPLKSLILRDKNVLIVTTARADKKKWKQLTAAGFDVMLVSEAHPASISLTILLEKLQKREVISILVEGGGDTLGSFIDEKLVDKVYTFHAPMIIGGKEAVSAVAGQGATTIRKALKLSNVNFKRLGNNLLTVGYVW